MFIEQFFDDRGYYVSVVAAFVLSIAIHEFCHAFVADRLGDHTAKRGGFATLNPFKTMGFVSIVVLLLFGFTWGAVPVRRNETSRVRRGAISLAGPLSNLLLMALAAGLLKWLVVAVPLENLDAGWPFYLRRFLALMLNSNAILFLLNMLPIPALDGWSVYETFLPQSLIPSAETKSNIFRFFIIIFCISNFRPAETPDHRPSRDSGGLSAVARTFNRYFYEGVDVLADRFVPSEYEVLGLLREGRELLGKSDYPGARKKFQKAVEIGSKYKYLAEKELRRVEAFEDIDAIFQYLDDNPNVTFNLDDVSAQERLSSEELSVAAPGVQEGAFMGLGDVLKELPSRWEMRLVAGLSALFAILCGWVALERKLLWQGVKYARGLGVQRDPVAAVKYFRWAARLGNALAHLKLARCYKDGFGVAKDADKAVEYYNKVKAAPDDKSCSPLLRKLRGSAQAGDAQAQYELGECYYFGRQVAENNVAAVEWYKKAAEQGLDQAQYKLGICYDRGEGMIAANKFEAVKWYRKAAKQGNADAQAALGNCYRNGIGVAKDEAKAVKWLNKAVAQGHAGARESLEKIGANSGNNA